MTTSTALHSVQTPEDERAARLAFARSTIIPSRPLVPKSKATPLDGGRRVVDASPKVEIKRPADNDISPHFAWTKKHDLDRASIDYWVRVPPLPTTTRNEWMAKTRSVKRTTKLLQKAVMTMRLPEEHRTRKQIRDVWQAVNEYQGSTIREKGKWNLPRSAHKNYQKLVEHYGQNPPQWVPVVPRTAEEKAEFPSGYFPEHEAVILPKRDNWTMVETMVDVDSEGEVVTGSSIGPTEIMKMYEDAHDWEGLERVKKSIEGWP